MRKIARDWRTTLAGAGVLVAAGLAARLAPEFFLKPEGVLILAGFLSTALGLIKASDSK